MASNQTSGSFPETYSVSILSNLAPLLALFGEQVSRQFLSQVMSFADCIVFATAPVGILTAVVSSIRLGRSKGLRTLIGRYGPYHTDRFTLILRPSQGTRKPSHCREGAARHYFRFSMRDVDRRWNRSSFLRQFLSHSLKHL